jgi:HD-GYP domain-containing protein (c-di-GMP phosphodiesterase class II)
MALADAYDAMVSRRVYKQEFTHEYAMDIIRQNAAKSFDPDVVAAFIATNEEFLRIAREYTDPSPAVAAAAEAHPASEC